MKVCQGGSPSGRNAKETGGKYSRTLSSLKSSLSINHSLYKLPTLTVVSLPHNPLPVVNRNFSKMIISKYLIASNSLVGF